LNNEHFCLSKERQTQTKNIGQSSTWGRPAPQVRLGDS